MGANESATTSCSRESSNMFSGLIGYRGTVESLEPRAEGGMTLYVRTQGASVEGVRVKDSVAIDGVCLTVTAVKGDVLSFDVVPETLACTTLGSLQSGAVTNVEYSLRVGDQLGGHFVYGHVDATAAVIADTPEGAGRRIRIERPAELAPMIAHKAFIAVDGVSLTVAAVGAGWFEIALIPETLARTTLGEREPGDRVNLEIDPLARYVHAAVSR
jgi:riboflavin synthase